MGGEEIGDFDGIRLIYCAMWKHPQDQVPTWGHARERGHTDVSGGPRVAQTCRERPQKLPEILTMRSSSCRMGGRGGCLCLPIARDRDIRTSVGSVFFVPIQSEGLNARGVRRSLIRQQSYFCQVSTLLERSAFAWSFSHFFQGCAVDRQSRTVSGSRHSRLHPFFISCCAFRFAEPTGE